MAPDEAQQVSLLLSFVYFSCSIPLSLYPELLMVLLLKASLAILLFDCVFVFLNAFKFEDIVQKLPATNQFVSEPNHCRYARKPAVCC